MKIAATLDHVGAAKTLHNMMRLGTQSKLVASLLTVQFYRLKWEIPDIIIPIPSRGSHEYARLFANTLGLPCHFLLKNTTRRMPQQRLPWAERSNITAEAFRLNSDISGKTVLLIDDLIGTCSTIYAAAATLVGAKRVYSLNLSKLSRL